MGWSIFATTVVFILANMPLLYGVIKSHGPSLVGQLWGYAPNQFFFSLFIFPFGALTTFWALAALLIQVAPGISEGAQIRPLYDHWVLWPLGAIAIACLLTGFDYWSSARSLDKLRPEYSRLALGTLQQLRDQLASAPSSGRDDLLRDMTHLASLSLTKRPSGSGSTLDWLTNLQAPERLGILLDANLQRRLYLLDPDLYVISIFQVAAMIGVGITLLFVSSVAFFTHTQGTLTGGEAAALARVLNLCSLGVVSFGLYSVCYQQYRIQLSEFAGAYSSTNPHYLVAGAVILLLLVLSLAVPDKSVTPLAFVARFGPLLALGSITWFEKTQQAAIRSIIGMDTNFGTQAMLATVLTTFFGGLILYSWLSLK